MEELTLAVPGMWADHHVLAVRDLLREDDAVTATVASALAESVSSRINDNIRVGVTALLMMVIMNRYLLGWS